LRASFVLHAHRSCFTRTVRAARTLSVLHAHRSCFTRIVRASRAPSVHHAHRPCFTRIVRASRTSSVLHVLCSCFTHNVCAARPSRIVRASRASFVLRAHRLCFTHNVHASRASFVLHAHRSCYSLCSAGPCHVPALTPLFHAQSLWHNPLTYPHPAPGAPQTIDACMINNRTPSDSCHDPFTSYAKPVAQPPHISSPYTWCSSNI